jgi:AAHS family 3-hydroxyphenylpropionic acid transporter
MSQDTASGAGRGTLLTLILCVLAAMIEGLDIQSAGVAAPRMAPEFHLDPHQLSYVLAASPLGLLVGAALGGRLADRFGRKAMLVASMATYGVFSILTAMCNGFESLAAVRLLCGLGLGGALPNLIALTDEASASHRRNAAVALMAAGMPLGGVVSSLIALHWSAPDDWRMIFYLGGAAPIVLAPLIAIGLPESRRFRQAREAGAPRVGIWTALFADGRATGTLLAGLSFFCAYLVLYLLQNWMPSLMVGKGFTKPEAFQIQGAFNVGGAAGAIVLGWLMDRSRRWIAIAIAYVGMAASLFALGGMFHVLSSALLIGLVVGVCVTGSQLIQYGLTSGLYATAFRGTGVGFAVALGRFGSIVGPLAVGVLLGAGKDPAQVLIALLPVVVVGGLAAMGLSLRKTATA